MHAPIWCFSLAPHSSQAVEAGVFAECGRHRCRFRQRGARRRPSSVTRSHTPARTWEWACRAKGPGRGIRSRGISGEPRSSPCTLSTSGACRRSDSTSRTWSAIGLRSGRQRSPTPSLSRALGKRDVGAPYALLGFVDSLVLHECALSVRPAVTPWHHQYAATPSDASQSVGSMTPTYSSPIRRLVQTASWTALRALSWTAKENGSSEAAAMRFMGHSHYPDQVLGSNDWVPPLSWAKSPASPFRCLCSATKRRCEWLPWHRVTGARRGQ